MVNFTNAKTAVGAWCSGPAWAYAPDTGTAWSQAWGLYDPTNPEDPIDPVNPEDPTPGDKYEVTQAELDKKEDELSSGPVMDKVKESIKTRDNAIVEAIEPSLTSNPENVKRVESIISSDDWDFFISKKISRIYL